MLKIHTSISTLPSWIKDYHNLINMKYVVICPVEDYQMPTHKAMAASRGKELCDLLCANKQLSYSYNIAKNGNVYYVINRIAATVNS